MGSKIAYYGFILPISYLPYFLLYALSDFVFVVMYYIAGYRKKVVFENIRNSFPEKTEIEHKRIMRKFYRHLCDLILESVKGFSISEKQIRKRMTVKNPEVVNKYFEQGKDIIFVGGHFNNWEMLALGIGLISKHTPVAIYKPLNNKFFNQKVLNSRQKYGLMMRPMKQTKTCFDEKLDKPKTIIFGADQRPGNPQKAFWMEFLNQDTPVSFGVEKFGKEYNLPIVFGAIRKIKRGHYDFEYTLLFEEPAKTAYGEITKAHTLTLEKDIQDNPQYWLWSHKRWKHKRPDSLK